jgi:arsenate reductase
MRSAEKVAKKNVLFICTHNSARSQMAEAFLRIFYGGDFEASSAGTEPSGVNPYTIRVMKEVGIDISKQWSKNVREFSNTQFDYVITVCDQAKESCPFFPGKRVIHKGFEDPGQSKGSEEEILSAFRKVRDEIKDWVERSFKRKGERLQEQPVFWPTIKENLKEKKK